jgi:EAL domain-containing protein (putative c-di-GMP-specific phosphodiesterase class I)
VKIDMALVRGADDDLARRTLLSALADFAEASGFRLVAEGIETEGELRAVAACGVHLGQGYLLGRPEPTPRWDGFPVPRRSRAAAARPAVRPLKMQPPRKVPSSER